jgi:hypothetical protein
MRSSYGNDQVVAQRDESNKITSGGALKEIHHQSSHRTSRVLFQSTYSERHGCTIGRDPSANTERGTSLSQETFFECWTTTAALARDTKRVRIGQMVTGNSYRNPALQAKMASTLDVLSHGRYTFGIWAHTLLIRRKPTAKRTDIPLWP